MRLFSQLFTVVSSLLFVCSVAQSRATGQSRPVLQKTVPRSQTTGSSNSQVPLSIALTALQQRILAGAPVKLQVVTTNTSTQPLDFWVEYTSDLGGWVYRVSVVDGSGNVPASTMRGRTFEYNDKKSPNVGPGTFLLGNGGFTELQPGKTTVDVIDVGRLYDLSQPGTYTIQVRRFGEGSGWVTSNAVTVTVVPSGNTPSGQTASSEPPFSLTISSPPGDSVRLGLPIGLNVVTTNTSNHNINLWAEKAELEQAGATYNIVVHDATGAVPPLTEFGHKANSRKDVPRDTNPDVMSSGNGTGLVLKPGESWRDAISVNDLFILQKPGDYSIQVERFDPASKTMVKSNTVTVTVTP